MSCIEGKRIVKGFTVVHKKELYLLIYHKISFHSTQNNYKLKLKSILYIHIIIYNIIICFILTPFLTLPSKPLLPSQPLQPSQPLLPFQPLLPSPLKQHNFTTQNELPMSLCCVCVCADLSSLSHT